MSKCDIELECEKLTHLAMEPTKLIQDDVKECPLHVADVINASGEGVNVMKRLQSVEENINAVFFEPPVCASSLSEYNLEQEAEQQMISQHILDTVIDGSIASERSTSSVHNKVKRSVGFFNIHKYSSRPSTSSESDFNEIELREMILSEDEIHDAKKRGSLRDRMKEGTKMLKRSMSKSDIWSKFKGCFAKPGSKSGECADDADEEQSM